MSSGRRVQDRLTAARAVLCLRGGAFALIFLILLTASVAAAAEPRAVLLIYADPRLAPAIVSIDETLRATIGGRTSAPTRFYTEYLDVSWFPEGQERYIGRAMREKYAGRAFDLVVPCGEAALRFALRERDALFPGVPMVFCTVEDAAITGLALPSDVTGVTVVRDWAAGLDLILRLHPGTRRIAFVSGAGPVERGWEELARKAFARYENRLAFSYLSGLSIDDTLAAVAALSGDTVVVFNVFLRDGAGQSFSSPEALARLTPVARVPIYGFAETQLGHGIVGGPLVGYAAQAARAGELARRVLGGERLGPGDIERRVPYRYMFDARQLARWGIPESRLPAGSIVRFQTPSLWREYRWHLVGAVGVASAQTLLIAGLLVGRRQRRRVQRELDERLKFEILLADLSAAFVEIPDREVDGRIGHSLRRIIDELGVDRAGLGEFSASGDQLRVSHAQRRGDVAAASSVFAAEAWPWSLAQLHRGQAVCVARLADLPPEAATDRRSFESAGTKAIVMMPLVVAGGTVGAFACSMRRERDWPAEVAQRLRLLADVFAVVLMRRRVEETVRRDRVELAHALRVATLGELAASLAHEINQPLAAIASNAQAAGRMLQSGDGDAEVPAVLRDIADDAKRAAQIIRRLRALFRKEHGERQPVDLGEVIKEVTGLLHRDLERRRIRLELVLQPDPPRVLGDIVQLQQVMLNVLMNAAEAMTEDPRELHIETVTREPGVLTITVRDSGPGVDASELEHIFERFVTTKPEGLGMGLSISRSIVDAHGGRIWATRNADRGLTMHVELPCLED